MFEAQKIKALSLVNPSFRALESRPLRINQQSLNLIQRQVLGNHDLRYGEVNDTLALQDGVPTYALPDDWRWVLSLGYTNPSTQSRIDLIRLSKEAFDIRYPDPTDTGPPRHYAIWETVLYIGPTPDQNLTLNRNWYRYLPDLENGAPNNTNAFVEQASDVLFFGALAHVSRYVLEDPRAPMWEAKFLELEADLAGEHEREKSSGRVPPPSLRKAVRNRSPSSRKAVRNRSPSLRRGTSRRR
jgi:hypothetical protein